MNTTLDNLKPARWATRIDGIRHYVRLDDGTCLWVTDRDMGLDVVRAMLDEGRTSHLVTELAYYVRDVVGMYADGSFKWVYRVEWHEYAVDAFRYSA